MSYSTSEAPSSSFLGIMLSVLKMQHGIGPCVLFPNRIATDGFRSVAVLDVHRSRLTSGERTKDTSPFGCWMQQMFGYCLSFAFFHLVGGWWAHRCGMGLVLHASCRWSFRYHCKSVAQMGIW